MNAHIYALLSNKHTSGSAAAYMVVKFVSRLARIHWPHHKDEIDATADLLEGLSVFYLGAAAVDAGKMSKETQETKDQVKVAITSGDTTILDKPKTL